MAQAGFWNYLREEITVSLASAPNRMVRIGKDLTQFRDTMVLPNIGDDMRANLVSYIVARALNLYCSIRGTEVEGGGPHWLEEHLATWDALMADLTVWTDNLPATFHPFSVTPKPGNAFPSEWMLKPWHVSALQYASLAKILLLLSSPTHRFDSSQTPPEAVQKLALRICGLARTNENLAAMLNSFGPLFFGVSQFFPRFHAKLPGVLTRISRPVFNLQESSKCFRGYAYPPF
ncbi:hypothetical protein AB5N19_06143 [Seiridium cardinale]